MTDPDTYDSTGETLKHSLRVGRLMGATIKELVDRSVSHDLSKTQPPELEIFNKYTPMLTQTTYGSDEYNANLAAMRPALEHHYAVNRHHPEHGEWGLTWQPIKGYEGYYEISNYGDVRSVTRVVSRGGPTGDLVKPGKFRRAHVTPKGYLRLALVRDGSQRNHLVHRLVADAFIPNPDNKPEVNHRNGDKRDNRASNLEWATTSENQVHAYNTGLKEPAVKYVVHCPELDLTTMGTQAMERAVRERGYPRVTAAGIWAAMDRGGNHSDLTFEGTLLAEHRRDRLNGMTLVDLIEMLADWKAATERHTDGSLRASLDIQRERFGISEQLERILRNTAEHFGWLDQDCDATGQPEATS